MRVLIIDDSKLIRARLHDLLASDPRIQVAGEAWDVLSGVQRIQEKKPDAVILDISMPGGSGIDIIEHVRNNRGDMLIIMLTNFAYPQYRKACLEAGADFFLDKSADFEKVRDLLLRQAPAVGS